jgi:hypothetical protein
MIPCSTYVAQNETTLYDLVPAIMRHARTAPPNVVIPELREAYLTFCRRTELLRVVQNIPIQRDTRRYQLCPPDQYQVIRAITVFEGSRSLVLQSSLTPCACGDFFMDGPDWLEFIREPLLDDVSFNSRFDEDAQNHTLTVQFCVAPARTSVLLDKLVNDQYRDAIVAGALSRLLLMPDTKWYNPQLAQKWEMEFKKGMSDAKIAISKNFTGADLRIDQRRVRGWLV